MSDEKDASKLRPVAVKSGEPCLTKAGCQHYEPAVKPLLVCSAKPQVPAVVLRAAPASVAAVHSDAGILFSAIPCVDFATT